MMKKNFSRVLAFLATCALLLVTVSAASFPSITLESSDSAIEVGETFSVYVQIDDNAGFDALSGLISYDTDFLTCTAINRGDVLSHNNAIFAANHKTSLFAAAGIYPMEGNGSVLEFVFRAKAAGDTSLALDDIKFKTPDSSPVPDISPLSITISAPKQPILPEEPPTEQLPEEDVTPEVSFSDVPTTHWAYTYIQNAVKNGLFSGIGNGQFGPGMNVTRGMFVTTLYSSAGSPDVELSNFTDVPANAWYAKAVAWASQQGIVSGIGDNKFGPDLPITREQIALILFNYADGVSPGTEMFVRMLYSDAKDIHDWALSAFTWALSEKLIAGKSGDLLDPLATATRAEVAVIMQNFVNLAK